MFKSAFRRLNKSYLKLIKAEIESLKATVDALAKRGDESSAKAEWAVKKNILKNGSCRNLQEGWSSTGSRSVRNNDEHTKGVGRAFNIWGECVMKQRIPKLRAGKEYRVEFWLSAWSKNANDKLYFTVGSINKEFTAKTNILVKQSYSFQAPENATEIKFHVEGSDDILIALISLELEK